MPAIVENIQETERPLPNQLREPKRYYFEVHGSLKSNGPELAIGYLTTEDLPATMKRLTSDYRFNHLNPERIIVGTPESSHHDLTELSTESFEPTEVLFGRKPYQLDYYKLIDSK